MNSRVALITFLDGDSASEKPLPGWGGNYPSTGPVFPGRPVDPGYGLGGGLHPSHGLPGGGYPSHGLPSPGHPSQGPIWLPVFPTDPTKPVDPSEPPASTKPIEPGDHFLLKCTVLGLVLVRISVGPSVEPT